MALLMPRMEHTPVLALPAPKTAGAGTHSPGWLNLLAVYLLIFLSGSIRYNAEQDLLLVVSTVVAVALLLRKVGRLHAPFVVYTTVFFASLAAISLYTNGSLALGSVVGTTLRLIFAYAVLALVKEHFIESYLRVVFLLAAVSLAGFVSDAYRLFEPLVQLLPVVADGQAYEGFLYAFRYVVQPGRNSSIFYEPGAYQIYLNSALFLVLFVTTGWARSRRLRYFVVLIIAIITTFSTTAYLMTALILAAAMLRSDVIAGKYKLLLLISVASAMLLLSDKIEQVVVLKLQDYLDIQHATDSSNRRSFDPLVDLQIFSRNPLGVGYDEYRLAFSATGQVREGTGSSNGITRLLAVYGLPFAVFLLVSYSRFFFKFLRSTLLIVLAWGLFIMALWSQSYFIFAPIFLAFIAAQFIWPRPGGGTYNVGTSRV